MEVGLKEQKELLANWKRLVTAGLGLARAANVLQEGRNQIVASMLKKMQTNAENGNSLAECRSILVKLFGEVTSELLIAGEQAGNLEKSLTSASSYVETQLAMRQKVFLAAAYPLFVALCGVILLPIPTLFRHGFAAALWSYYLPVATALTGLYLVYAWLRSKWQEKGEMRMSLEGKLKIVPLLGSFFQTMVARLFFSTLACIISAGGSLSLAIESACRASGSYSLHKRAREFSQGVSSGNQLSDLLAATDFLPKGALQEIRVGEETGNLEGSCSAIAQRCDEELATRGTALAFGAAILLVAIVLLGVVYHIISFWLGYFNQGVDAGLF